MMCVQLDTHKDLLNAGARRSQAPELLPGYRQRQNALIIYLVRVALAVSYGAPHIARKNLHTKGVWLHDVDRVLID